MTTRFCHGCNAEVEIVEGTCLLGHEPRAVTPASPLADLRAEVDRAFTEAQIEVEALRLETPVHAAVGATGSVPGPISGTGSSPDEVGAHIPRYLGPPLGPPPPPPPPGRREPQALMNPDGRIPSNNDPITQFAPPPRVDWGPERLSLFGLGRLLRTRG